MDEIRNQSIKLFSEWLDKQTNFTTSIKIVCGQGFESIYDDYISRFISRRPELDEEELIPFLLTLRTFYNKDGDVDLTAIAKSICANFTAPEAKQREVKWPEKMKCHEKEKCGRGYPPCSSCGWNEAIDACKKAYEEAQPASSVNAEVVEALRGLVDDEECSFDHHGYCQTHFSGSMPCLMEKARKALKKVGYD